jgi:8-oxo-dGTP pyrophosphatase MutT (NUDIX family)
MKEIAILNPEDATESECATYKIREASRAIVFDSEGKVALLHVSCKGYYKLPGGGIDADEGKVEALKRECLEEIGCTVDIMDEIGVVTEFRKMFELQQISYCYKAQVLGEKGTPEFTESELTDGFKIVWVALSDAISILNNCHTEDKEGALYIVPRDLSLLMEASSDSLK